MSRQSTMTPEEAQKITTEVYGRRGQRKLARDIGRGDVTISRWLTGTTPVGDTEAVLLRLILMLHRRKMNWRRWVEEYLKQDVKPESVEDLL